MHLGFKMANPDRVLAKKARTQARTVNNMTHTGVPIPMLHRYTFNKLPKSVKKYLKNSTQMYWVQFNPFYLH